MEKLFVALVGVFAALSVAALVLDKAVPAGKSYSFSDRAGMQMLIDACRTGHHLCK